MTDNNDVPMIGQDDESQVRLTSVEDVYVDDDGEWTVSTFGCSCCSTWISDWDLSDNDIEQSLRHTMKRHLRLAEEYRVRLEKFLADPARVNHDQEDR